MIKIEDECVGPCPMGCVGPGCKYMNIRKFYCDDCGEEVKHENLREFEGRQVCVDCILDEFPVVE